MNAIITVSEITNIMKNLFDTNELLRQVYIRGEISNFKHHLSGHMYFTLKDEKSQIRCVMFKNNSSLLTFVPKDGISVIASGYISIFAKNGTYQLYTEDLHLDGLGDLYIAFEKLKTKLEKEGLFAPDKKRIIPFLPQRIGVITSLTGAAVRDLLIVIKRRFSNVDMVIVPVLVQGRNAANEISSAICELNGLENIDVIIVGRGGGSIEELWAFNEEKVARAIYNSKIPVISAVGHETDYTIADLVADKRAPTPSAAGEIVIPEKHILKNEIKLMTVRLLNGVLKTISARRQKLEYLKRVPVYNRPESYMDNYRLTIDQASKKMNRNMLSFITGQKSLFNQHIVKLQALSPLSILKRGYSVCINAKTNKVVKQSGDVKIGDSLLVRLSKGKLLCNVKDYIGEDGKSGLHI